MKNCWVEFCKEWIFGLKPFLLTKILSDQHMNMYQEHQIKYYRLFYQIRGWGAEDERNIEEKLHK